MKDRSIVLINFRASRGFENLIQHIAEKLGLSDGEVIRQAVFSFADQHSLITGLIHGDLKIAEVEYLKR